MSPADSMIDPDLVFRDAIAAVAVSAYAHDVNLTLHIDNRLPARMAPLLPGVPAFLRRGLLRTIETDHSGKITLALWLEEMAGDGTARTLLEVCRAKKPPLNSVACLADIWTLPLGGGTVRPRRRRTDDKAESVLIPLSFRADRWAPLFGARWGGAFNGRRLLHARDVLVDTARFERSMAQLGAELGFAERPDAAMDALAAAAEAGRSFDAVVFDGGPNRAAAVALARRIRAEPALAATPIVLAGALRGERFGAEEAELFDVLPRVAVPWRRLLEVLHELFRRDGAAAPPPPAGAPAAATNGGAVPMLSGRRILIAEDVETNQVLLQAVLAHTGAAIEMVTDGAEVIARHGAAPADLIMMDLQMPGVGGIAALRSVRAMEGPAGTVPVIALTAHCSNTDRKNALAAGMDAFLAKPIVVDEFYDVLRRLLPPRSG